MRLRRLLSTLYSDERGIGLLELVVVLAILVGVVGTISSLFASAIKTDVDLTKRVQAQEQARIALELLRRDVHCASSVVSDSAARAQLTLPAGCPSGDPSVAMTVTWCSKTNGGASRNVVYRAPSAVANCSTGTGITWADYLTSSSVFAVRTGGTKHSKLCVLFSVDVDPADALRRYRLRDELVLRNTPRLTGAETPCPTT